MASNPIPPENIAFQFTITIQHDGQVLLGLPGLPQSVNDRAVLIGHIQAALLAAAQLPLQQSKNPLLMPNGGPIPPLRGRN